MDIVSLWDKTLQLIKGELSPPSFNAFFKQIIPLKIHMNELILLNSYFTTCVKNAFLIFTFHSSHQQSF